MTYHIGNIYVLRHHHWFSEISNLRAVKLLPGTALLILDSKFEKLTAPRTIFLALETAECVYLPYTVGELTEMATVFDAVPLSASVTENSLHISGALLK